MENELKMKKVTCKICGFEFPPIDANHYISRDSEKTGIVNAISGQESKIFDTFDCPWCGCQNIVQERKRPWLGDLCDPDEDEDEDEDESEEETDYTVCDQTSDMSSKSSELKDKFEELKDYINNNIKMPEPEKEEPYETRRDGF